LARFYYLRLTSIGNLMNLLLGRTYDDLNNIKGVFHSGIKILITL
jgi:hypothetical protein